jgi:hypothetical protein
MTLVGIRIWNVPPYTRIPKGALCPGKVGRGSTPGPQAWNLALYATIVGTCPCCDADRLPLVAHPDEKFFEPEWRDMETKLYVGNLSYSTTEEDLRTLFAQAGTVTTVTMIKDRDTGRSKGFAFVEMGTQVEAQQAISRFNGQQLQDRALTVNLARPREERPRGGGGGFGDRDRGGGGGRSHSGGRGDRR